MRVRQRLRVLGKETAALSDWRSRLRMLRLRMSQRSRGDVPAPPVGSAVAVNAKALAGGPIWLRPRSSDVELVWAIYANDWYLPPPELAGRDVRRVVELGTNVGAGLAALATRYPQARLLGVEPDPANVQLARRNVERFGERCAVLETAIWPEDADLVVERSRREYALVVRPRTPDDPAAWPTVHARSLASVLGEFEPDHDIDFMFMDIEGVEQRVLEAGDLSWSRRVHCIRVECEREYGGEPGRCAAALSQLGFDTRIDPVPWGALVVGVRN